jgi:hypothetical protein
MMPALQGSNVVGDVGAAALGDALKANSSLQKLFLVAPFSCFLVV